MVDNMSDLPEEKLVAEWSISMILVSFSFWVAGNVEWVLGTTTLSYWGSLFLAFLSTLLAGFLLISISIDVIKS